jgi:hypothetical protein
VTNSALHLKFAGESMAQHAPFHILRLSTAQLARAFKGKFKLPASGQ